MTEFRDAVLPKSVAFTANESEFLGIALKGALLQLPTFGFYRFWLNTDIRRHLWSHTTVDGDALEYTGTGRELLLGFLFAIAILAPIYFAYFLLGVEVERMKAFGSLPLVALLYLFGQYAIFRGRRYRLTRTIWRGVRFSMQGSGWAYAWRAALWALAAVLTVGLAHPARAAALERFKMRATSYGDKQGDFAATGQDLFDRAGWLWLASFALVAATTTSLALSSRIPALKIAAPLLVVVDIFALPLLFATFKAREWRWWAEGLRIGSTRFSSTLKTSSYVGLFAKFVAACFGIFLAGFMLLGIAALATGMAPHGAGPAAAKVAKALTAEQIAPLALIYLAMLTAVGVAQRYFLQYGVWRLIVGSLEAHQVEVAQAREVELPTALGEGLADSLDFGF